MRKHNAPRGGEAEHDRVYGKDDGDEILGLLVHDLEVDLLAAGTRVHGAELEPDKEAAEGKEEAEDPEHERCAYRADRAENGGRGREDSGANDTPDAVLCGGSSVIARSSGLSMLLMQKGGLT